MGDLTRRLSSPSLSAGHMSSLLKGSDTLTLAGSDAQGADAIQNNPDPFIGVQFSTRHGVAADTRDTRDTPRSEAGASLESEAEAAAPVSKPLPALNPTPYPLHPTPYTGEPLPATAKHLLPRRGPRG
jgi:hypothetical protein